MDNKSGSIFIKAIRFLWHNLEAFIWLAALIALAFHDPSTAHYTLCPLKNLGFDFCPGCGLGHSISHLFRGEIIQSFEAHPLGIIAVILLIYRIISLFYKNFLNHNTYKILRNG
jgi:hypothetical protein